MAEFIRTAVVFFASYLAILSFVVQPFVIPSGSMQNTLPVDLPLPGGRFPAGAPARGDIVVFRSPVDGATLIKRVVGLPGERIQVIGGVIHINDRPIERVRLDDTNTADPSGYEIPAQQYRETLPGGASFTVLELTESGQLDNTGVYEIPAGHYFMMGDNRDDSTDSRVRRAVGFVPAENILGPAVVVLASMRGNAPIWQIWRWPEAMRWDRAGALLR
jgi:signal peptidase I